jgi:class 3 adenylate cyclase/tetratricopeptide (TPR) repeat protein
MPDLHDWLKACSLEALAGVLAANDVDLDILPDLTDQDLEKLGISLGHRRKLLRAVATLRDATAGAAMAGEAAPLREATAPVATPEAERRQVTVLFSDLVGSTALSTVLDPEDMSALIRRYQDACAGAVARFDGYIAKFMGDGVLAYFGYPQAREDAAERSVRAALAIIEAVRQIKRPDGIALETRVGIATGLVVVGDIVGTGAAREEAIVGETPNLAARLQSLAEPNTVLVSEATYRLLGRLFEYDGLGEHALKGFAKPVPVWRILRDAPVASRFEAARPGLGPFVGRVQEMGLLMERWHLAQQSEGQAIVITAESGMGKSRLVEALFERIGGEPHRRIVTQCSPYHSNTAFYPVMRQIEHAAGFVLEDSSKQKLDKLDAWLAELGTPAVPTAPLLADLLSLPPDGRYQPLELTPAQRKTATVSALVEQLVRLSEREPVLFVLEDAHWIDPTTQDLLTRLIDSIVSARLFVIVTARPEFASPWSGRDHVGSLALNRLSRTQCAEIVAGIAAAQSVAADLLEEILAKTDGVPLFVEELTRAVAESAAPNRLAVPATLQDSLMARLDRLGPAKEIAQIAAAIGRQFAQALLAAVAPVGAGELDTALAQLTDARLVFPQTRAIEPTYSFKHALTRDVAYDSLLRARRQQLHERIARTLEERFPSLAETEPEILAHHFGLADLPGPASLYSERAGDRALSRSAYQEAIAHFSAGLKSAEAVANQDERMRRQLDLLLKLGPTLGVARGMQSPEAADAYRRAAEIGEALGDGTAVYRAKWGLWLSANLARKTALARERAGELVTLAQRSGDDHLLLEAYHCRWSTAIFRGDVAAAIADGRIGLESYDMARHRHLGAAFGGHDPGVCAHVVSALALQMSGDPERSQDVLARGIALAETLNHPNSLAHALHNGAIGQVLLGDRESALASARRAVTLAEKFGLLPWRASSLLVIGWASATGSGVAEAARLIDAEIDNATSVGPVPQFYLGLAAEVLLAAGRPADGLAHLDRALAAIDEPGVGLYLPQIYRLRGQCLLALDRDAKEDARQAFIAARDIATRQGATIFVRRAEACLADL